MNKKMRSGIIAVAVLVVGGLAVSTIFFAYKTHDRMQKAASPEEISAILGPGFPKAFEKAVEMCGADIQLIGYQPGGYYAGKVYPEDMRFSKDKVVTYNFTQGECAPGHYAQITAIFDIEQNAVIEGPYEHKLAVKVANQ